MFSKRRLLFISVVLFTVFLLTTRYILYQLNTIDYQDYEEFVVKDTVEANIYHHLRSLPEEYKTRRTNVDRINRIVNNIVIGNSVPSIKNLWKAANSWVATDKLVDVDDAQLKDVLYALKYSPIVEADLDSRGTQLKLLLTLQGGQKVVFKPKWYEKDKIIEGPVYAGKDRYGSEIIGFYLSLLLNKPLAPISIERHVSLKNEVFPVSSDRLLAATYEEINQTCVYGKCFYCKKEEPICEFLTSTITGAVIFNIKPRLKIYRSPWQRTYSSERKALWQQVDSYCNIVEGKLSRQRIYDLIDTAIFDFLIQNGDRHHYETLNETVLLLDNGKGLGNPYVHHIDVLAPLYQCCMLRKSTINSLLDLSGGMLTEKLKQLPDVKDILSEAHFKAMDDRLLIIFATIEYCKKKIIEK